MIPLSNYQAGLDLARMVADGSNRHRYVKRLRDLRRKMIKEQLKNLDTGS